MKANYRTRKQVALTMPMGRLPRWTESGDPLQWPIPGFLAYWVSPPVRDLKPGKHWLSCRAVNNKGDAQPMPRPCGPHEGVSDLQSTDFEFTGS